MAFFKRVKRTMRRGYKRAGTAIKKRYGTSGGLSRLVSDMAMVKTALNVERKNHTVNIPQYTALSVAAPICFTMFDGLAQGTGPSARTGDQVKYLWSQCRISFDLNAAGLTANTALTYRVMVILDKEPRGDASLSALTLAGEVLEQWGSLTAPQEGLVSFYRTDAQVGDRFKILRDFKFKLDNIQVKQKMINIGLDYTKLYSKTKGLKIKYSNTIPDNSRVYVMVLNDDTNATPITQLTSVFRSCYVDN